MLLFLLTIVYSSKPALAHDVPMASFHITTSDDASVQIDITFDLEDFAASLAIKADEVNLEKVQGYLDEHTSFQFNHKIKKLKISSVKIVRGHIKVKGSFGKVAQKINNLKIENTCLNNVYRHSNVIQVDLNNSSKDYRMHEKRTVIDLSY